MIEFHHIPVMLEECLSGLDIKENGIYVDGTLGGAGHSSEIAKRLKNGKLIGIDKDSDALSVAQTRFGKDFDKVTFVKSDFKNMVQVLDELGIDQVDGILLDLGVSSYQVDTPERGFSYRFDGRLDMRMDKTQRLSAYDVVNTYSIEDLSRIIYRYGEEQFARLIAKNIVETRQVKPIETTTELKNVIEACVPKKFQMGGSPCKKTFQAIRIEVNGELNKLDDAIHGMIGKLKKGGRLVIITFHSLEDRIVKDVFREEAKGCLCDKSIPVCICHHQARVKLITKKPLIATKGELDENKRSSSAKVRIVERI